MKHQVTALLCLAWFISDSTYGDSAVKGSCDIEAGARVFQKCQICHALSDESVTTLQGPSLKGVIGRQAGTLSTFRFSPAMQSAEFVWSTENLRGFVENPARVIPGNRMPFRGINSAAEREAIVCYIEQYK